MSYLIVDLVQLLYLFSPLIELILSLGDNLFCIFCLAVADFNNNALLVELTASPFGQFDLLAF
jgi:hypothetical protein